MVAMRKNPYAATIPCTISRLFSNLNDPSIILTIYILCG